MAAAITQTLKPIYKNGKETLELTMVWTAHTDGAVSGISTDNGTFCSETITKAITGRELLMMQTEPGTTTAYTIVVNDAESEDLFGTLGARSTSATESAWPLAGGSYGSRIITGALTPVIASAGSGGTGTIILHFQ